MTNAEHIFTWARCDRTLCSAMVAARAYPEGKNFSSSRASQVFEIARARGYPQYTAKVVPFRIPGES